MFNNQTIDKEAVYESITSALLRRFETAKWSAHQAYDAATNEESVAENKYDTFGLEASYLAHGQSQRVMECENDYLAFSKGKVIAFEQDAEISLGALVCLESVIHSQTEGKWFYLSVCAGGLSVEHEGNDIYLVTLNSPVGRTLLGKMEGDEVTLKRSGNEVVYEITRVL